MAIAFRSASTGSTNSGTTVSAARPAGVVSGDVLVAFLRASDARTVTPPSGWSLVRRDSPGSASAQDAFVKVAGGSEPANYEFAASFSTDMALVIVAYTGVDTSSPVAADSGAHELSATITAPSVSSDGALVVAGFGVEANATISTPSGTTSRAAVEEVSFVTAALRVVDFTHSGGDTGNKVATASAAGYNAGQQVVLTQGNLPPLAPTPTGPADGSTIDRDIGQRFAWSFNDPDSGDSQSKYDLRYRQAGTAPWTTVSATTPNKFHDFAAATFADGTTYEWQVRTYDQAGEVSPYSTLQTFTAETKPSPPTITSPTSGGTVSAPATAPVWSTPEQVEYQVQRVADAAGSIDTGTVYEDSGAIASTAARSYTLDFDVTDRYEWIRVRVKVDGLWSDWFAIRVFVSYTPPATSTATVTAGDGVIEVTATHPTPAGGEPTVTAMNIWRRRTDGSDEMQLAAGTDLAPTDTFGDHTPASGVAYEYRVEAVGDNGVSSYSAWTE